MGLLLLIILVIVLLGTVPAYPYSRQWGYRPAGGVGLLLAVVLILLLLGVFPWGWGSAPGPVAP